ncbi:hypothetical protein MTOK_29980 [Mycolicibacterium tokaiense]|nr:hypothetical protein MTOK_29980 [Mycolicibacterium tokaiense]
MPKPFVGSEAVAAGQVTKYQLAQDYQRLLPNLYTAKGPVTLEDRTLAAWKWSKGRGVITGLAASALHGAKWVDTGTPVEMNLPNSRSPRGVITRNERLLDAEVMVRRGVRVTTPVRTAFDLARRDTEYRAIARLDALSRATRFSADEVLELSPAPSHPRTRARARTARPRGCRRRITPGEQAASDAHRCRISRTADADTGASTQRAQVLPRHGLAGADGGGRIRR